jgi:hypothetical protein
MNTAPKGLKKAAMKIIAAFLIESIFAKERAKQNF